MASLIDLRNGHQITLHEEEPFILGRGNPKHLEILNPHVSRKQVQISLLDDGRCFIERLAPNPSLLNGKQLPLRKEIQVFNGDTINLIPNDLGFKVITSDIREGVPPVIGPHEPDTQDSYATQEGHGRIEDEGQSSSDESSLLGNASWSDE
ncbi:hypothetical protein O0I10_007777 [Lichtheimia ornata]|uniref:FHA domain-containing protein n=1 Tax=Lichtheimia ornata TaxID=688661 RepID=A0AAD7UZF9_9FUNG|nr:uncharacterized protein O0I10_007777 [Lichtheimia ornata]KAJ8656454.1 hypothetical protein O0I10_007777 [Lichtheimia ornata]